MNKDTNQEMYGFDNPEFKKLSELYYDPMTGFSSYTKIMDRVRQKGINLTSTQVSNWIREQHTYQVNKKVKKQKDYTTIFAYHRGESYQLDVIVYKRFAMNHYEYILTCIDVYSRKAAAIPLTNMRMETLLKATEYAFKDIGGFPKKLNADNQFNKREFIEFCKENNITPYFSDPYESNHNAIVERFNGTLAGLLQKWRQATKRYDWYKVLPDIIDNYNSTTHRTLGATPDNVYEGNAYSKQEIHFREEPTLKLYDTVRIKETKGIFDKGDALKYGKDKFMIIGKRGQKFMLEDVNTGDKLQYGLKNYQLQKI